MFYTLPCAGSAHAVFVDQKMEFSISPLGTSRNGHFVPTKWASPFHLVVFLHFRVSFVHTVLEHKQRGCPISLLGVLLEQFLFSWEILFSLLPLLLSLDTSLAQSLQLITKGSSYRELYPVCLILAAFDGGKTNTHAFDADPIGYWTKILTRRWCVCICPPQ